MIVCYSKTCVQRPLSKKDEKMFFKTKYRLMQAQGEQSALEHSAILSTFIKLPIVIKIFVLSIF